MLKLRNIQRRGFYYCQNVEHPALFMVMRAGKSILTLKDILYNNTLPALICTPLSVVYNWELDLLKLGITDYQIIVGTKTQKRKKLKQAAFTITNKEFYRSIPELNQIIKFKSVVLDESTCIKNPSAKITKFYLKNFKSVQRRYILTGTPMSQSEMDIHGQLQFLDPSILNKKNYWDFRNYYFYEAWSHQWQIKADKENEFYQKLNSKCFFITLNDVRKSIGKGELKTTRTVRSFSLKPKIQKIYDKLKRDFIVQVGENPLYGINWTVQQLVYLRKLCSGFITLDPETKETQLVDDSKYRLLLDILDTELINHKVIILCNFYDEVYTIEKFFKRYGKKWVTITGNTKPQDRKEFSQRFQNSNVQYLLANTKCLEFGVTLSNADITIEFSSVLGSISREQVEMRGSDIYKDDSLNILHLVVENSVDMYFFKQLEKQISRKKLMDNLLTYLR